MTKYLTLSNSSTSPTSISLALWKVFNALQRLLLEIISKFSKLIFSALANHGHFRRSLERTRWENQSWAVENAIELYRIVLKNVNAIIFRSNCQTLGGFLPESCFLQVFKPILEDLAENIIRCLEGSKFKILQNIQTIY